MLAFIIKLKDKLLTREVMLYGIFGVITTVFGILMFQLFRSFNIEYKLANSIAIFLSIVLAFITNKIWVFESRDFGIKILTNEFVRFVGGRIITYFLDMGILIFWVEVILQKELYGKVIATIVVIILNYFISKKGVFTK